MPTACMQVIEHMEEADPNFPTNDFIRNKIESERSVFLSGTDAASVAAITEETVVTETAVVQVSSLKVNIRGCAKKIATILMIITPGRRSTVLQFITSYGKGN